MKKYNLIKEREYKKWLDKTSNRHNPNFDGLEKFLLTWSQIREIISEEKRILLERVEEFFVYNNFHKNTIKKIIIPSANYESNLVELVEDTKEWAKFKKIYGQ